MITNSLQSDFPPQAQQVPQGNTTVVNVPEAERLGSVAAGAALAWYALTNFRFNKVPYLLGGAFLLYRGISGNCPAYTAMGKENVSGHDNAIDLTRTVTVLKPRAEVYEFWRQLENLPLFMDHIEQVVQHDATHSTWRARIPGGLGTVSWEAEITEDVPNGVIAWRSLPGSTIHNTGRVVFRDAPGGKGTEIQSTICYRPPAGEAGMAVAKFFNPLFKQMVKEDMRRLKRYLEAGEIASVRRQPTGRDKESLTNSDAYKL